MLKIEKHIIRMVIMLGVGLCVGYAAEIEAQFQSELEIHRARVAEERRKIETQFANCKLCKGSGEMTQKMTCETCGGGGVLMEKKGSFSVGKPCPKCKNKGYLSQRKICWKCRPYDVQASRAKPQPTEAETKEDKPKCDKCKGKGRIIKEVPCSACHGQGGVRIPAKKLVTGWSKERWSKCGICNASGKKSVWEKCSACNGKGAPQEVGDKNGGKEKEAENSKPDVVKWIQHSAEKGNANAQYCLGVMCAAGDSVQKDVSNAVKWLSKASEQRHVEAQSLLLLAKKVNENPKDVNGAIVKKSDRKNEETMGKSSNVDTLKKQRTEFEKKLAKITSAIECFSDGCEIHVDELLVSLLKRRLSMDTLKSEGFNYVVTGTCNGVPNTRLQDINYLLLSEGESTVWMNALKVAHAKVIEWVAVAAENDIDTVEKEIPIGFEVLAHSNTITYGRGQQELYLSAIRERAPSETPVTFFCKIIRENYGKHKGEYSGWISARCGYFNHVILRFSGDKTSINNDILLLLERYKPEVLKKAYLEHVKKQDMFK